MDELPTHAEWRRWLEDHTSKLLLFARQQARFEADAEDLVQEAVMECLRRQGEARPPALPLVFATIRRRSIDMARSQDRRAGRESAVRQAQP